MIQVNSNKALAGNAYEISINDEQYPSALRQLSDAPEKLYIVGNISALQEGLAVVGARKATPYGISCTKHFASIAVKNDIVIISGGAYGCDSASHRSALAANKPTVVFLGGGCNELYPIKNAKMFQEIIDKNGAIVSEHDWNYPPLPQNFLARNRLIAGLAKATLIVEAGLPSGTFSTADFAIKYNKEVFAVPGPITNDNSSGCNKLIYEGAKPIINDEIFFHELFQLFPHISSKKLDAVTKNYHSKPHKVGNSGNPILDALSSQAMSMEDLFEIAKLRSKDENPNVWLSKKLVEAENTGRIAKYPNGMYGPVYKS